MNSPLSRRDFLKTGAAGAGGMAMQLGAAERGPKTIIDTHTHFYDPSRPQGVPWPNPKDTLLYRTVMPGDYKRLPKPSPVKGTVVVEASPWIADNDWILELAAREPFITGLVGNLPVGTDEFGAAFERLIQNRLFRGLRVGGATLRQRLGEETFIKHLRMLAENDRELDLNGPPDMLPDVDRLAAAIPELRIVLNHVCNLKIDGKAPPEAWMAGMQSAAKHKNVFAKVSGLVEGTGHTDGMAPNEVEFYRPVLDVIWTAFGQERLIYGSNWPVSERYASLATVQGIVTDYFSTRGQSALENVFWRNARKVYRWVERSV